MPNENFISQSVLPLEMTYFLFIFRFLMPATYGALFGCYSILGFMAFGKLKRKQ